MIAEVNTSLMVICDPDDVEHAEAAGEYLERIILSQAGVGVSGAWF